jgi:predicted  nucleic acid-binding Zn-ribbon protein
MSKTTHYELNTPIGSEVLSVMTGLNPNFTAIDGVMYDNETRSTQALNKANVNEQNIATALGRITTAEGDIDTLESGLETANTNISGLTSRMGTAESNIVSANNRIQENTGDITELNSKLSNKLKWTLHSQTVNTNSSIILSGNILNADEIMIVINGEQLVLEKDERTAFNNIITATESSYGLQYWETVSAS